MKRMTKMRKMLRASEISENSFLEMRPCIWTAVMFEENIEIFSSFSTLKFSCPYIRCCFRVTVCGFRTSIFVLFRF